MSTSSIKSGVVWCDQLTQQKQILIINWKFNLDIFWFWFFSVDTKDSNYKWYNHKYKVLII